MWEEARVPRRNPCRHKNTYNVHTLCGPGSASTFKPLLPFADLCTVHSVTWIEKSISSCKQWVHQKPPKGLVIIRLLLSDKVRTAPSLLVLLLWAIPSRLFLHSDNNLIINTGSWLFHFMPFKSWDGGYESFLCRVNLLLWILFEWNPQQQLKPNTLTSGFLHFIWTG